MILNNETIVETERLNLDFLVQTKKHGELTFRELLAKDENYVVWMFEAHFMINKKLVQDVILEETSFLSLKKELEEAYNLKMKNATSPREKLYIKRDSIQPKNEKRAEVKSKLLEMNDNKLLAYLLSEYIVIH